MSFLRLWRITAVTCSFGPMCPDSFFGVLGSSRTLGYPLDTEPIPIHVYPTAILTFHLLSSPFSALFNLYLRFRNPFRFFVLSRFVLLPFVGSKFFTSHVVVEFNFWIGERRGSLQRARDWLAAGSVVQGKSKVSRWSCWARWWWLGFFSTWMVRLRCFLVKMGAHSAYECSCGVDSFRAFPFLCDAFENWCLSYHTTSNRSWSISPRSILKSSTCGQWNGTSSLFCFSSRGICLWWIWRWRCIVRFFSFEFPIWLGLLMRTRSILSWGSG